MTTTSPSSSAQRIPWLGWIAASAAAGAATGLLENSVMQFAATLLLQGFLVGLAQWLVMRRLIRRAWRWILATGFGLVAGYILMMIVRLPPDQVTNWLTQNVGLWEVFWLNAQISPLVMLPAALLQAFVLRPDFPGLRWVGVSLVAALAMGMAGATAAWLTSYDMVPGWPGWLRGMMPMAVGWAVYALVTAPLLRRREPERTMPSGAEAPFSADHG